MCRTNKESNDGVGTTKLNLFNQLLSLFKNTNLLCKITFLNDFLQISKIKTRREIMFDQPQ